MQKILIANRGEIASRIIRTCKQMGLETVAVFSDADKDMPFVKNATKAIFIGDSQVAKSYLDGDKILKAALSENVDGIHPGYGFLSENPGFAKKVTENDMTFIGPTPETIQLMGDKIIARKVMEKAGVPVVPGSHGLRTIDEALSYADSIGFPIMLKASGGGGGIGMILCEDHEGLKKNFESTKARAKSYFGNDEVFIEKYIPNSRHIEVQIFGDKYGNIVHLFERDCSIQRRHQKVVEESPSPFLSEKVRNELYDTAIKAAKAVNYTNAGTIEFIVDENQNFYFLEMNTRLQVEHPVTEQISGLDLVKWQLMISQGKRLPLPQSEISQNGHAIEFRLYAEDPIRFFPSPGKLTKFKWEESEGIRIDSGYEENDTITPFYDPMIAKCIFNGETRDESLRKAEKFFNEIEIEGVKSNIPLFLTILADENFRKGIYNTNFLKK